eukprot:315279-Amphidinium_carterae.1
MCNFTSRVSSTLDSVAVETANKQTHPLPSTLQETIFCIPVCVRFAVLAHEKATNKSMLEHDSLSAWSASANLSLRAHTLLCADTLAEIRMS